MKLGIAKIEVEATIVLSRRDLELLHHMCSYSNKDDFYRLCRGMESSHYSRGVEAKELGAFMDDVRAKTSELMSQIESSKLKLFGSANTPSHP